MATDFLVGRGLAPAVIVTSPTAFVPRGKAQELTARRNRMEAEALAIGGMLSELEEPPAPPIEFDEKLWHAVVDHVTVMGDDRLVYSLKDGSEITVRL